MKKKMDSHVQNSKCIIKQFIISENSNTNVLDLKNKKICEKGPSKIGIVNGYYDAQTENLLSAKYESLIGQVIKKLNDQDKKENCEELSNDDINLLKKFLIMLMARIPSMIEKTSKESIFLESFKIKLAPSDFINIVDRCLDKDLENIFFAEHYPVIIYNKTSVSFISSVRGFFLTMTENNEINWWFPITPKIAVSFVGKNMFDKFFHNSSIATIPTSEKIVQIFNDNIVKDEMIEPNKVIFSNKTDELERILREIN